MLLFYETWFVILMLVLCPPLGISLMAKNLLWEKRIKILISIASVALSVCIVLIGVKYFSKKPEKMEEPVAIGSEIENFEPSTEQPVESSVVFSETFNTPESVEKIDEPIVNTIEIKENLHLTSEQIERLSFIEKYKYLLGKEFYENEITEHQFLIKPVIQSKYDVSIEITTDAELKTEDVLKMICEKIYRLGYKSKTMQIVLKINKKKIAAIENFSSEISSMIRYSVFENGEVLGRNISIDVSKNREEND